MAEGSAGCATSRPAGRTAARRSRACRSTRFRLSPATCMPKARVMPSPSEISRLARSGQVPARTWNLPPPAAAKLSLARCLLSGTFDGTTLIRAIPETRAGARGGGREKLGADRARPHSRAGSARRTRTWRVFDALPQAVGRRRPRRRTATTQCVRSSPAQCYLKSVTGVSSATTLEPARGVDAPDAARGTAYFFVVTERGPRSLGALSRRAVQRDNGTGCSAAPGAAGQASRPVVVGDKREAERWLRSAASPAHYRLAPGDRFCVMSIRGADGQERDPRPAVCRAAPCRCALVAAAALFGISENSLGLSAGAAAGERLVTSAARRARGAVDHVSDLLAGRRTRDAMGSGRGSRSRPATCPVPAAGRAGRALAFLGFRHLRRDLRCARASPAASPRRASACPSWPRPGGRRVRPAARASTTTRPARGSALGHRGDAPRLPPHDRRARAQRARPARPAARHLLLGGRAIRQIVFDPRLPIRSCPRARAARPARHPAALRSRRTRPLGDVPA